MFTFDEIVNQLAATPDDRKYFCEIIPQLAVAQTPIFLDELAQALGREYLEFLTLLIHELVIEGVDISAYPHLKQVSQWMQEMDHPLSKLPLKLLPAEREMPFLTRKFPSIVGPIDWDSFVDEFVYPSEILPLATLLKFEFEETTTSELQKRLQIAVTSWSSESIDRIGSHQFRATSHLNSELAGNSPLLNIECLRGLQNPTILTRIPEQIVGRLFTIAANGGPYSDGLGNAYGRLAVWQSIAAFVNKPEETPIFELHQAMYDCQWFELETKSSWFINCIDSWDLSIIAFDSTQQILTTLAATTCD